VGVSHEVLFYEVGQLEKRISHIHRRFFPGGVVRQLAVSRKDTRSYKAAVRFSSFAGFIATTKSSARDRHPCEMPCLAVKFHWTV